MRVSAPEKGMQVLKAKRQTLPQEAVRKAPLARAEILDKATRGRFEEELDAATKRRPTNEAKVVGALRTVAPMSPALRTVMAETASVMIRRGSYDRELYAGSLRCLAECADKSVTALLKLALASDDAGGSAALSAASFSRDPALTPLLAKLAASRQSHMAFSAETARVARGESNGAHLTSLAPMIKESHRISLCVELFVPLVRSAPIPVAIGPALGVLRSAERHLGRWLVLAEVAARAGDRTPVDEAKERSEVGPSSARSAWSLVHWALLDAVAAKNGDPAVVSPTVRPTVELIARLSDRPSANRDTTFLFRMAQAKASVAKAMLESLAKALPLADEVAIRAALYLARDYGRRDLVEALVVAATDTKKDELRGLAAAALWDIGDAASRDKARELADELVLSKIIGNVAWGALIRAAAARGGSPTHSSNAHGSADGVVAEASFRWTQWGWLE